MELVVVVAIVAILTALTLVAVQRVRDQANRARCSSNLRQLGLAVHQYHDGKGVLPPGVTVDSRDSVPMPFLSWNARILPYIEQGPLWIQVQEAYRQDPNFLRPPHKVGRATVVLVFACPGDGRAFAPSTLVTGTKPAFTCYLGVEGTNQYNHDGVLFKDSRIKLLDITDGTSHTLMIGERPPSADERRGWWYAGWGQSQDGSAEMVLGLREINTQGWVPSCPPGPYFFSSGRFSNQCDAFHFWSPHIGGAGFAFADGSVRFLRYDPHPIMPALATRAGNEAVAIPE